MYNPGKIKSFFLKSCYLGPHVTFFINVMQQPESDLFHGTVPGPRAQMVRLFLVFTYIWQEDLAKIPKEPGAQRDINPARQ